MNVLGLFLALWKRLHSDLLMLFFARVRIRGRNAWEGCCIGIVMGIEGNGFYIRKTVLRESEGSAFFIFVRYWKVGMSGVKECMDWQEKGMPFSARAPTSAHWLEPRVGGVWVFLLQQREGGREGRKERGCISATEERERDRFLHHTTLSFIYIPDAGSSLESPFSVWNANHHLLFLHPRSHTLPPRWCEGAGCPARAEEVPWSLFDCRLKLLQRHQTVDYVFFWGFVGINNSTALLWGICSTALLWTNDCVRATGTFVIRVARTPLPLLFSLCTSCAGSCLPRSGAAVLLPGKVGELIKEWRGGIYVLYCWGLIRNLR